MKKNKKVNINSNEIEKICPAGFGKSIFAAIIDAALVILCIYATYFCASPYFIEKYDVLTLQTEVRKFYEDCHLVYFDDKDRVTSYKELKEVDDDGNPTYSFMVEKVWYYYVDFLAVDSRCDFSKISESKSVIVAKEYVYKNVYGINNDGSGNKYFTAPLASDGSYDFSSAPILKEEYATKVEEKDNPTFVELFEVFNKDGESGYYIDALNNLENDQEYLQIRRAIVLKAESYAMLPGCFVYPTIFFFIIPLINKKGRTIGKMVFRLELVSSYDNKPTRLWQRFIHYGILLAYLLLILCSGIWFAIVISILGLIIDNMVRILNKKFQSFHDIVAHTIVIDTKKTEYKVLVDDEVIIEEENKNQSWEDAYIRKASDVKKEAEEDERLYKILDMSTLEESDKVKEEWRKEDSKDNALDDNKEK